jgi:hypothetical protein
MNNLNQFNPVRDVGNALVTTVNQVVGTGIQTAGQINAGVASTILSLVNGVPAPPTPPPPPAVQMPGMGQNMNIAPTGVKEEDFDVVE